MLSLLLCALSFAQGVPPVPADDLGSLLSQGEVNLLETWPDGRLKQVTTIAFMPVAPEKIWSVLVDFEHYEDWMPQVAMATESGRTATMVVVDWRIAVVGPDVQLQTRYTMDAATWTIQGKWEAGALPGSTWSWRLVPVDGGTRVYRSLRTYAVDSNWVLKQVEDENHTLDYGLNSAVGVIEVRGLRRKLGV